MAGYYLHSLNWEAINQLVNTPSPDQIAQFAANLSERLQEIQGKLESEAVMFDWPVSAEELVPFVRSHFTNADWYSGLSSEEGHAWEMSLLELVESDKKCDSRIDADDSIYWFAIDYGIKHHEDAGSNVDELRDFGTRPFHYERPEGEERYWSWYPTHSMHTPEETEKIARQLQEAKTTIENCNKTGAVPDYEDLMEVFEIIIPQKRALYITVDT